MVAVLTLTLTLRNLNPNPNPNPNQVDAYEQRATLTLVWATLTGAGCSLEPLPDQRETTLQAFYG